MNPEPIWDWPSSVQFLGRYRVEGESSKFRNSVGYITAMNALQCNAMATDAIMAKHNPTSMGRPTKPIELSAEERGKLQEWARRPKTAERLALRSRIVLGCADGLENRQVARQLHVTDQTVCKWRERFRTARLEGLVDEPRPGTPCKITDAQVEALITYPASLVAVRRSAPRRLVLDRDHGSGNGCSRRVFDESDDRTEVGLRE